MGDREEAGGLAPAAAFKLLGNGTRIGILRTLWEADDGPLGFSELYRRAGVSDSGQFNYHLEKLVGHFVTASDEGYDLSHAGVQVVQSVVAGTAIEDPTLDPVEVDRSCPACGAPVRVQYERGHLTVTCTGCEGLWGDPTHPAGTVGTLAFPPAALRDRTPVEALDAGAVYLVEKAETAMRGVCPECAGRTDASLDLCESHDAASDPCDACGTPFLGVFTIRCATCKSTIRAPSFAAVHHHPEIESMYAAGRGASPWDAMWRGIDWPEEILRVDPPTLRTTVERGGDRRVFDVHDDCTVTVVE